MLSGFRCTNNVSNLYSNFHLTWLLSHYVDCLLISSSTWLELQALWQNPLPSCRSTCTLSCDMCRFTYFEVALTQREGNYRSCTLRIVELDALSRLLLHILHDRNYFHLEEIIYAITNECRNIESLATSLTYQSALAIFMLLIDIEVIEVVVIGIIPSQTNIILFCTESSCRCKVLNVNACRSITCWQHCELTEFQLIVRNLCLTLHVEGNHIDGLAIECSQVIVGDGPTILLCYSSIVQSYVRSCRTLCSQLHLNSTRSCSLVNETESTTCCYRNHRLIETHEVITCCQATAHLNA